MSIYRLEASRFSVALTFVLYVITHIIRCVVNLFRIICERTLPTHTWILGANLSYRYHCVSYSNNDVIFLGCLMVNEVRLDHSHYSLLQGDLILNAGRIACIVDMWVGTIGLGIDWNLNINYLTTGCYNETCG